MGLLGKIQPLSEGKDIYAMTGPGTLNLGSVDDGILIRSFLVIIVHGFDPDNTANIKLGSNVLESCSDIDVIRPNSTEYFVNQLCDSSNAITFNQSGSNIVAAGEGYIVPNYQRIKT